MKQAEFARIGAWIASAIPGLVARKNLVFHSPIRHILRGICFDQATDKRAFYVQVFLQPLFVPLDVVVFSLGWRLGGPSHIWHADAPGMRDELLEQVKRSAVPFLALADSIEGLTKAIEKLDKPDDIFARESLGYTYAYMGDLERCRRVLAKLTEEYDASIPWVREIEERARWLIELLSKSPELARTQLRGWEDETAINLGLSAYHQPNVDPLESPTA
jgi:hypothetical protein